MGVIGGGVSGLTAAYEAARGGAKVAVYKEVDYLGGHANIAQTVSLDGSTWTSASWSSIVYVCNSPSPFFLLFFFDLVLLFVPTIIVTALSPFSSPSAQSKDISSCTSSLVLISPFLVLFA